MREAHKEITMMFGKYVFVGTNLFSTTPQDKEVTYTKTVFHRDWTIVITPVASFNLNTLNTMKMEEHPVALNFINSVVKSSLRDAKLRQIGRSPLFFDPEQRSEVGALATWPGFFTSTWIFQRGLYLIIDNVSKVISNNSCLDQIYHKMEESGHNPKYYENAIQSVFQGAVVLANYGNYRTYRVNSVNFKLTPKTHKFVQGDQGGETNMLQYFERVQKVKIRDPDQPLLEIVQKRGTIYLPPELCQMVGIPDDVRKDFFAMNEIKKAMFLRPDQKVEKASQLSSLISKT